MYTIVSDRYQLQVAAYLPINFQNWPLKLDLISSHHIAGSHSAVQSSKVQLTFGMMFSPIVLHNSRF